MIKNDLIFFSSPPKVDGTERSGAHLDHGRGRGGVRDLLRHHLRVGGCGGAGELRGVLGGSLRATDLRVCQDDSPAHDQDCTSRGQGKYLDV